ncbi:hypothetical protein [Actinomadura hibisca]|uniref:hypothetical protein n=1 Tax=Actinomadura hibisca TaxID=68565 RepID=UPI00082DACBD|nr:hypothetical protein [Actinomadura hibisca]
MIDDELLGRVRAAFQAVDPVPEGVVAAGRAAFAWRVPGAGLAELADEQEERVLAGARGGRVRALTFTGAGVTVEVEVHDTGRGRELTGRLTPAVAARVRLRHVGLESDGAVVEASASGHFVFAQVPEGLASLVFELPDASTVVTSWVRL